MDFPPVKHRAPSRSGPVSTQGLEEPLACCDTPRGALMPGRNGAREAAWETLRRLRVPGTVPE